MPRSADVPPSPPRITLGIGVTGHRLARLPEGSAPGIAAAAASILEAIGAAAARGGAKGPLRMITSLADGADALLADAALERGWRIDVVLPLAREAYSADFAGPVAQDEHARRLAAAHAVFELTEAGTGDHALAYERAGRLVLAQSDLLVAIWDGEPARGRGGAAQIVAEAVLAGIPVVHLDPAGAHAPRLLWDGLDSHDQSGHTIDTVPHGDLSSLETLIGTVIAPPAAPEERTALDRFEHASPPRTRLTFAYPLLLAIMGVRALTFGKPAPTDPAPLCASETTTSFAKLQRERLLPRFARADAAATHVAQLFRSGYVTNFALAALAVLLALASFALPSSVKPALLASEIAVIATILVLTRVGNRAGWHRRWLDNRQLAERLRCLAVASQLGELQLRAVRERHPGWVDWYVRGTARELGLPSARVDANYLGCVRTALLVLIEDQLAYLRRDARQMHHLEHRLHVLGTVLFGATALVCIGLLGFKLLEKLAHLPALEGMASPIGIGATIASAAFPTIGAAIYGIRMQGDFAGTAERSETLAHDLSALRATIDADALDFDTLKRRIDRATALLTQDLAGWLHAYHARPLTLPG